MLAVQISHFLDPLIKQPLWAVTKGYGSFFSMEIGHPLDARPVHQSTDGLPTATPGHFPDLLAEYRILIYCCDWQLQTGTAKVGSDSDEQDITAALSKLNGLKINNILINPEKVTARIGFDNGGTLKLHNENYGPIHDQLVVFRADGRLLKWRGDGRFSLRNTWQSDDYWQEADNKVVLQSR